jgi:hypothetical protein
MRHALILATVIATGAAVACEHADRSWCEGDWKVDLFGNCDGAGNSLEKQKCAPGGCVEGDFGAECVLTTAETCTPEAVYCKGNVWVHCGRSGHPQWEFDCVEYAKQPAVYGDHRGRSCVEGFGTAECVHTGLPCAPEGYSDCVGDYLVHCGSTGFAIDFEICTNRTPPMRCVIEDGGARCRK